MRSIIPDKAAHRNGLWRSGRGAVILAPLLGGLPMPIRRPIPAVLLGAALVAGAACNRGDPRVNPPGGADPVNPANDTTFTRRGDDERLKGRYDEAIQNYDEAIRLN